MDKKLVSVVIPSYNRAHLLKNTIPSYIQEDVGEVIVVDDCSTDNTEDVLLELKKEFPQIKYYKMKQNGKQTAAKNEGKKHAIYPFIYFGDDDSFIVPGTIHCLLETMSEYDADVVGAKALYLNTKEELNDIDQFILKNSRKNISVNTELDIKRFFYINFNFDVDKPMKVPFCHACALIKTPIAHKFNFDTRYKGNAFREETDYFTQISDAGYKVYYNSAGVQINLPRETISGKYNSLVRKIKGSVYEFINTYKYLKKNIEFIKKFYHTTDSYGSLWRKYMMDALKVKSQKFVKYILP